MQPIEISSVPDQVSHSLFQIFWTDSPKPPASITPCSCTISRIFPKKTTEFGWHGGAIIFGGTVSGEMPSENASRVWGDMGERDVWECFPSPPKKNTGRFGNISKSPTWKDCEIHGCLWSSWFLNFTLSFGEACQNLPHRYWFVLKRNFPCDPILPCVMQFSLMVVSVAQRKICIRKDKALDLISSQCNKNDSLIGIYLWGYSVVTSLSSADDVWDRCYGQGTWNSYNHVKGRSSEGRFYF